MSRNLSLRSTSIALAVTASLACGVFATGAGTAYAGSETTTTADPADQQASAGQGPETAVSDEAGAAAAASAPTITRGDVIERAKTWVGIGLNYSWTGSHNGYRTDCSGYVSMAWHLGSSMTTDTFAGNGVIESISKGDLKPGDALLNDNSGANGHVVLFGKWIDGTHSSYMGYEFTGSGVHYRQIPYPYYSGYGTFLPVRNKSVIDDVVRPADPGMTDLVAGDFNGNGKKDLVAVEVSSGKLWLYPGTGTGTLTSRVVIGTGGWNDMANLAVGDLNKDGKDDVIATEVETGKLFLYKGTGSGLASRVEVGTGGWNGMKNVLAGDFNADGKDDVVASEIETGKLFLYKGTGTGALTSRVEIGTGGWNGMSKAVSPGDMNKDGKDDVIAAEKSTGKLFLYKGTGSGLAERVEIGTGGWNGISDYAGGDFTGDGVGDLAAVESQTGETGKLYLYKGTGTGSLTARTQIGTGGW
ncbi:C40 family peptidase [Streptomyces sp. NBC_01022]|uniref:C40 family peptidase n=1 Tax=Streptomyces sp. NBC_01022 TaxID=2903723 RepID=UPI002DDC6710|nr:FG-GAP-like repeat-containing protein [Streptomyces sp. NBC_01022]WRZ81451.1 FG-GAP-like repeat-containing protein [Streptomyces sp. NBC_01022]